MRAGVAMHSFKLPGGVNHLAQVRVVGVYRPEFRRILQRRRDADRVPGNVWHQLGHPVDLVEGNVHDASHIPDSRARLERPEGDNLRHLVLAIFLRGVFQQLVAAVILEVQIDIRHGCPPRIQEAFENQTVFQRTDQRNSQGISHN